MHPVKMNAGYKAILIFQKSPRLPQENYIFDVIHGSGREKNLHEWLQSSGESRELLERFIQEGDLNLNPFGGSGTIATACRDMNRRCMIIEEEDRNIEIIKARLA